MTKLIAERVLFMTLLTLFWGSSDVAAQEFKWEDVYYTTGPYNGGRKTLWSDYNVFQKTQFLELHYKAIRYCMKNMGKPREELNPEMYGRNIFINDRVTPLVILMMYRQYGDEKKAAQIAHQYWLDSKGNPAELSAEENPDGFVLAAYIRAGMYREALDFYNIAYKNLLNWLSLGSDTKLLNTNLQEYEQNWPEKAARYKRFVQSWKDTKKLAKTAKPKPLDPSVQHHEWFYSDKQEKVLKALAYYHQHKVQFMLEKVLKHEDPVIAAKAKEYLDSPVKETAGDETKK